MQQPLHVAGTGLACVGLLFLLISLATPGWLQGKGLNYGLFKICNAKTGACSSFSPEAPEAAVRFFVVVGFLLALTATLIAILYFIKFVMNDVPNRILPLVAALELVISGMCVILGCIIMGAKVSKRYRYTDVPDEPGYSFVLAIMGALCCLTSGVVILVQRNRVVSIN